MKRNLFFMSAIVASLFMVFSISETKAADPGGVESARKYITALNAGEGLSIYSMLPASYKKDVSGIVSAFAAKMDPEIWSEGLSLVGDLVELAGAKADLLVDMSADNVLSMSGASLSEEDAAAAKIEAVDTIAKVAPELKQFIGKLTLDSLKDGNVEELLGMQELLNISKIVGDTKFGKEKLSILDVTDGSAGSVLVSVKNVFGKVEDTEFVKVEDSWIPKSLADGWADGVASAKKGIADMVIDQAIKNQILAMAPMFKMAIQQGKSATTKEELGQAFMMPIMMMAMSGASFGGGADDADDDDDFEFTPPVMQRQAPSSRPAAPPVPIAPPRPATPPGGIR